MLFQTKLFKFFKFFIIILAQQISWTYFSIPLKITCKPERVKPKELNFVWFKS